MTLRLVALVLVEGIRVERRLLADVDAEDLPGGRRVRPVDPDLHVEAARSEDGRVDQVLTVGGTDDHDVLERLDPVELGEELGHDGRLDVGADAGASGAEQGVHLVEENDDRHAFVRLLLGPLEDQANLTLGLADPLVEELGSFDVQEIGADVGAAGPFRDLLGEAVGDCLGDEGLATARRPVEEDALRRVELVLTEQILVHVREARRCRGSARSDRPDLRHPRR